MIDKIPGNGENLFRHENKHTRQENHRLNLQAMNPEQIARLFIQSITNFHK